jgi:hypothetical protein
MEPFNLPLTEEEAAKVTETRNLCVTDSILKRLLSWLRRGSHADKRFDINLIEGKIAEGSLARLLQDDSGMTVEVKRDFKFADTGNIAVEGSCNGKPSGIMATEAEWWAYVLDGPGYDGEVVVLMKTERLRKLIAPLPVRSGGDKGMARFKLLPLLSLLRRLAS